MDILNLIQSGLDKIPSLIVGLRGLIEKGLSMVNLSGINPLVFGLLSILLAFLFLKQFVTGSLWAKLSTLLNLLLLALLIYVTVVYIG